MYDIIIRWKNNEMETFENIREYRTNKDDKYLCLYLDNHTWFVLHENILVFEVYYRGNKNDEK